MEEAVAADLVLHVIDASHPQFDEQRTVGDEVLRDLGVAADRVVEVYNKLDRTGESEVRRHDAVGLSALTGRGLEALLDQIRLRELKNGEVFQLEIPHNDSRMIARLHEVAEVYEQRVTERGTLVTAWIPRDSVHIFEAYSVANVLRATKVS
jgi:GTP-binding protein HflX